MQQKCECNRLVSASSSELNTFSADYDAQAGHLNTNACKLDPHQQNTSCLTNSLYKTCTVGYRTQVAHIDFIIAIVIAS